MTDIDVACWFIPRPRYRSRRWDDICHRHCWNSPRSGRETSKQRSESHPLSFRPDLLTYTQVFAPQQLLRLSFRQLPKLSMLSLQYHILWTSEIRPVSYPPQQPLLTLKWVIIKIWGCITPNFFLDCISKFRYSCSPCRCRCLTGRWQRSNRERRFAGYSHLLNVLEVPLMILVCLKEGWPCVN